MARGRKRLMLGWGLVGVGALLAAVIVVSAWVTVGYTRPQWHVRATSGWCSVSWGSGVVVDGRPVTEPGWFASMRTWPELAWWAEWPRVPGNQHLGPITVTNARSPPFAIDHLGVAIWAPATMSLVLGVRLVMAGIRAARRSRSGLCPACGYNLQGLPPTTPCPECNSPTPPQA